jgi:hypothetical protein
MFRPSHWEDLISECRVGQKCSTIPYTEQEQVLTCPKLNKTMSENSCLVHCSDMYSRDLTFTAPVDTHCARYVTQMGPSGALTVSVIEDTCCTIARPGTRWVPFVVCASRIGSVAWWHMTHSLRSRSFTDSGPYGGHDAPQWSTWTVYMAVWHHQHLPDTVSSTVPLPAPASVSLCSDAGTGIPPLFSHLISEPLHPSPFFSLFPPSKK